MLGPFGPWLTTLAWARRNAARAQHLAWARRNAARAQHSTRSPATTPAASPSATARTAGTACRTATPPMETYIRVCVCRSHLHASKKCDCESFSNNNHGYYYSHQRSYVHYHYVLTTTYYDHYCYYVWKSLFAMWASMLLNNNRCWLCL